MEVDTVSKSYFNLEEVLKKEAQEKCETTGKIAKDSCDRVKLQREKLDQILYKLGGTKEEGASSAGG